ncbi:multicopper oxidase family protein [Mycobacterium sp. SM1]|uniref:multicopper oxidase family protein n=1 Tax=Mycobacterium sp. SM1 TaxID=2816243 RepID=UPI001BCFCFE7|nr:multicopper oxidase family protein [Mycobacterium sp. SM1]MBS4727755.1 multicopper oxidase family protein [Mycobacterium sp. SM1]
MGTTPPGTGFGAGLGQFNRRTFITAIAGGVALAACTRSPKSMPSAGIPTAAIAAGEAARPHTGRTVSATLAPARADIDLGGIIARTLAYNSTVPGPLIRANVGDELAVTVKNGLDHPTSVHWHGVTLRCDMDGAAPVTPDIDAGRVFTYRFTVPRPGTYWAHPHTHDFDLDAGLYLPLLVDDPAEPAAYDAEWIVMLDDWTDGVGPSPRQIFDGLRAMSDERMSDMPTMSGMAGSSGMGGVGSSDLLGGDGGDVAYPYYLINGRVPLSPSTFSAKPGQRVRIRLINAGSDTAFRVALAGHRMTVTHTDGNPVTPTEVDAVLLGMGERYDVIITAGDGVFPLVAAAEGKDGLARALLSTGAGNAPDAAFRPPELKRRVGTVEMFSPSPAAASPRTADVDLHVRLSGQMMPYDWLINGHHFDDTRPLRVRQGQQATITFDNTSTMWHPMHLHGHVFQVMKPDGGAGPCKDTVIVLPRQKLTVVLAADNPGVWMLHCHNTYHIAAGMMTTLDYIT